MHLSDITIQDLKNELQRRGNFLILDQRDPEDELPEMIEGINQSRQLIYQTKTENGFSGRLVADECCKNVHDDDRNPLEYGFGIHGSYYCYISPNEIEWWAYATP